MGDTGGRKPRKGYVCRACGSELHYIEDCPDVKDRRSSDKHSNQSRRVPHGDVGPDECWFCLSNPSIAKHLLVAVGGEERNFKVPGGGHVLIVPIAHFATLDTIPGELRASVMGECNRYIFTKHARNAAYTPSHPRYQAALRALYAKHGATAVFFEMGRVSSKGGHTHIQAVPVPLSLEDRVESAFRDEGRLHGIDFDVEEGGAPNSESGEGYFRVELPDGRRLVHRISSGLPFSVQFGRYDAKSRALNLVMTNVLF